MLRSNRYVTYCFANRNRFESPWGRHSFAAIFNLGAEVKAPVVARHGSQNRARHPARWECSGSARLTVYGGPAAQAARSAGLASCPGNARYRPPSGPSAGRVCRRRTHVLTGRITQSSWDELISGCFSAPTIKDSARKLVSWAPPRRSKRSPRGL